MRLPEQDCPRRTAGAGWLLRAWESAGEAAPAEKGAVLAHAAGLAPTLDAALDLRLDDLTALLARLHAEQFGPVADGVLDCGTCGAALDVAVPVGRLDGEEPAADGADGAGVGPAEVVVPSGRVLTVRVPTTRDLVDVRDRDDVVLALLDRCLDEGSGPDRAPGPAGVLDAEDRACLGTALERLAGAAAVTVRTTCPGCATSLSASVDVADFVAERVAHEAQLLLGEVAELARAFGWSEADVLRLSTARRHAYLVLARGRSA